MSQSCRYSKDGEPCVQQFSVAIVWSSESNERLNPDDLQNIIEETALKLDDAATVEVAEIVQPVY